jgi:hypothetical protein
LFLSYVELREDGDSHGLKIFEVHSNSSYVRRDRNGFEFFPIFMAVSKFLFNCIPFFGFHKGEKNGFGQFWAIKVPWFLLSQGLGGKIYVVGGEKAMGLG